MTTQTHSTSSTDQLITSLEELLSQIATTDDERCCFRLGERVRVRFVTARSAIIVAQWYRPNDCDRYTVRFDDGTEKRVNELLLTELL